MAPALIPAAAGASAKDFKKESATARLLGSGSSPGLYIRGSQELTAIQGPPASPSSPSSTPYPPPLRSPCAPSSNRGTQVDTIAKRLMSNQGRIASLPALNAVVFKAHAADSAPRKFASLFPGLGYAAGYKVLQRVYKYGGQPFVRDYLAQHHGATFDNALGKGTGKAVMHATAGSLVGIGEIVLLPLDVLKIKRQTNPEAFRGRGVVRIVADEGMGLYRGAGWTAARNAPGSFAVRAPSHLSPPPPFYITITLAHDGPSTLT